MKKKNAWNQTKKQKKCINENMYSSNPNSMITLKNQKIIIKVWRNGLLMFKIGSNLLHINYWCQSKHGLL
jgi:hypothetical protein